MVSKAEKCKTFSEVGKNLQPLIACSDWKKLKKVGESYGIERLDFAGWSEKKFVFPFSYTLLIRTSISGYL